jgi:hypothetical protein
MVGRLTQGKVTAKTKNFEKLSYAVLQLCSFAVLRLKERDSGIIVWYEVCKKVVQSCSRAVVQLLEKYAGIIVQGKYIKRFCGSTVLQFCS